jgi:hypothetical protein
MKYTTKRRSEAQARTWTDERRDRQREALQRAWRLLQQSEQKSSNQESERDGR